MIRFLLDTNALIELIRRKDSAVMRKVELHLPGDIGVPVIALYELYVGAYRSTHIDENLAKIGRLALPVLSLSPDDVQEASRIRVTLEGLGTVIGPNDLLIAGQAKARGLVLVTHNVREFSRVAGLVIEDWQSG